MKFVFLRPRINNFRPNLISVSHIFSDAVVFCLASPKKGPIPVLRSTRSCLSIASALRQFAFLKKPSSCLLCVHCWGAFDSQLLCIFVLQCKANCCCWWLFVCNTSLMSLPVCVTSFIWEIAAANYRHLSGCIYILISVYSTWLYVYDTLAWVRPL